jgi:hypothetical protein
VRRRLRLVEAAPQLTKFADIELREAQSRLPVAIGLSTRHSRSVLASRCGRSKPVDWSVIGILVTRHLATGFAQSSNGRSHGMRQPEALSNLDNGSALGSLEHPDQLCTLCAGSWLSTARSSAQICALGSNAALAALDSIGSSRAVKIAAASRRSLPSWRDFHSTGRQRPEQSPVTAAHRDSSVALVCAMHPSILIVWPATEQMTAPFQKGGGGHC